MVSKTKSSKEGVVKAVKNFRLTKVTYLIILLIGLLLLAYYKKSWLIAATVDGALITNFELLSRMNQQFRTPTLNQMVNEKIILSEAKKRGLRIGSSDIDQKIIELEKNVGGTEALDSLLSQQGQTRASLRDQLKIQLLIEKIYEPEATVSAEEVNQFIEQNKETLQATDSAGQIKETTELLKQQKLGTIFREKFQQLKQQAKVQIF